jgi:hypothetical protein
MTDSNIDMCAVCGCFGKVICCDTCPMSFHHSCVGYSSADFMGNEESWSCWECCRKRPNLSYMYDTKPVRLKKKGTTVYVATNHSCMSYFQGSLQDSNNSELELLVESHGKERLFKVNITDQRIWRGRKSVNVGSRYIPLMIEQSNGKFVPAFHEIEAARVLEMLQDVSSEQTVTPRGRSKRKKSPAKSHKTRSTRKKSPDAPLSDANAAAVLGSLHLGPPRPRQMPALTDVQHSNRWKMTSRAMKLNEGDRVEAWMDPTEATPGGWAPGVVERVVHLGTGSTYPFFAFYLIEFDHLHISIHGNLYSEWRPLAYRSSENAQEITVQVRSEMQKSSGTFSLTVLKVGDQVESKLNGLSCPGVIRRIDDNHRCTIEFKSPQLNPRHKIPRTHSRSLKRQSEEPFQGMLSIVG